ncbi:aspartate aminotransferase family protein [Halocatena pleomorpha]|uniref:Putative [LysW]-aminoadipate semialdehyde/glutamate semialdehyde transaminase n=1 Tax=Halocatena pleomorpha TaxID=1785090 RepID=A0A3P3RFY5_9EURY|nr:acetylornithine/succinylornithine family transaminase [Halocatena pleomorpha]RRJ32352.1 acetylornithine/succinylornithine family transaminase [Halocatena pleomorpha]
MTGNGFVFSEKPIRIDSGSGPYLYDADGTEYLDFGASYAVTPTGHCHPAVVDAIQQQTEQLLYVQGSYPLDVRDELHGALAASAPGDIRNVWLCNSGTEANEAAIKFARSATGRSKIVATKRGFHGRTLGALAATWKQKYKEAFEPLAGDFEFVPYGDAAALDAAVDEETAAVLLEPIQGEGGINPAPEGYLQAAREATADTGAALVLDEIQTGLGRTGTMWATEQAGVVPDILTTAKGLASGLPIGATLCRDWIAEDAGNHGSTFSGGPVVCAAATATLDVIEDEQLADHAADIGASIVEELQTAVGADVRDIRGQGLMIGVEVKQGANRLLPTLALEHGILALPAGRSVLRLLPPLIVDHDHADHVVNALTEVL